jgi:cardiolipin synthase
MELTLTPALAWTAAVLALDVVIIARAVMREQGVERTLMWVFAILAFPGLGAVAYLMLASPSIRRARRRKRRANEAARAAVGRDGAEAHEEAGEELAPPGSLPRLAGAVTGLPPTAGNRVELLADDERAFLRIEEALAEAKRSIWAEYYIVKNDATGRRFMELLREKAAQGVEVLFLYDGVGSLRLDEHRLAALRHAGGRASIFLPLNPLRQRWSVQLRNHRKIVVVDGELGFTGGMNIGDEYSGLARKKGRTHFRDSHLALRGPCVRDLAQIFAEDWAFATGEPLRELPQAPPSEAGRSVVSIVPSGPDQKRNAIGLVYFSAVAGARRRVWLTSPYFVPDESISRALESAALRGVDVRLLVPAKSDVALAQLASRSYFPRLVAAGVAVYEYLPSMHHAKTMVVDDELSMVGSANVDVRSLRLNFELSALVHDRDLAARLSRRFEEDLQQSRRVTAERLEQRNTLVRLRDGVVRLLSPLL